MDLVDEEDRALPLLAEPVAASATTRRRSATPEATAETSSKCDCVSAAMIRASVVLPEPGGPQRTIDGSWSASIARRSTRPSPTRCSWPTNSSSERGRMRAASGACRSARARAASAKRLSGLRRPAREGVFRGMAGRLSHFGGEATCGLWGAELRMLASYGHAANTDPSPYFLTSGS